jgi:hypothetical protein
MNIQALCTENKCLFFVCNSGLRAVRNYSVGGFSSGEILAFCCTGKIKLLHQPVLNWSACNVELFLKLEPVSLGIGKFIWLTVYKFVDAFCPSGGLLSTAQSYPSLTTSGPTGTGSCGISTTAGNGPCLSQALTMSLTSTSSDSEQVSLEVSGIEHCAGVRSCIPVEYVHFEGVCCLEICIVCWLSVHTDPIQIHMHFLLS